MSLPNLQAEFIELVFSEDANLDWLHPIQNIRVYRENITSSMMNTLRDIYPMICKLLGEACFRGVAQEYIRRYPSRSSNLHDYGEYLGDFLAELPTLAHLTYLKEVAQFEWCCHLLHYAADPPPFDCEHWKRIGFPLLPEQYDQVHFILHPAAHLQAFQCPLLRIIDLCDSVIGEEIDLNEGGVNLLIIRREFEIKLVPLPASEYAFLSCVRDGLSLAKALAVALQSDPAFMLEEKLQAWVSDKTIVDCY
jgi:hypothetical protein